jgi:hypothetical protein
VIECWVKEVLLYFCLLNNINQLIFVMEMCFLRGGNCFYNIILMSFVLQSVIKTYGPE